MLPISRFKKYIEQQQLFLKGSRILLAVSGGKDSVLMVHLFKAIGVDVGIAHCNFNLRAGEAQRDESFVQMLASALNLPYHVMHFETKRYAEAQKISTQMAARTLRYSWFEEIRSTHGYDYIALAQHQNDAIETVLVNLIRGTGISGLHGILPKRDRLIRPLLFFTRKEIDALVENNNIDFVEDSSNLSSNYTRNKLRLEVIPRLRSINPNLEQTFAENIARFTEIETFLSEQVSRLAMDIIVEKPDGFYLSIDQLIRLKPQKLLLFELLKPFGFSDTVVDEIIEALNGQSGKLFFSQTHQATINRDVLIISIKDLPVNPLQFVHPEDQKISFGQSQFTLSYVNKVAFEIHLQKAYIDAEHLIFPLIFRNWQKGDRFIPFGMDNFKKISDFFIDEKVPLHLKNSIPILINGNGDVVWIAGMRLDNRYKLTKATKKVAIFELKIN